MPAAQTTPTSLSENTHGTPTSSGGDVLNLNKLSLLHISTEHDVENSCFYEYRTSKRTVEGSPMFSNKRMDTLPTPHISQKVNTSKPFSSRSSISSQDTFASLLKSKSFVEKRVVIFSASDTVATHSTGSHQENELRTILLNGPDGCLKRKQLDNYVHHMDSSMNMQISLADFLRVHDFEYLKHLQHKCNEIGSTGSGSSSYPYFYPPAGSLDPDTPLSAQSFETAKNFCSAAVSAVDYVMKSDQHRAFVIGRPPGHHSGPSGCVVSENHWRRPDMSSSGFCLLNTVAVAAAYARYNFSQKSHMWDRDGSISSRSSRYIRSVASAHGLRIAIVDIDIHHGNGTEEIVRNLTPHMRYLPLPSSYAPIGSMSYKPWYNEHDADDVFFSSIHLFASDTFYPGTGREIPAATATAQGNPHNKSNIVNVCLTPIGPVCDPKARAKLSFKQRLQLHETASKEMRDKVQSMLLPRLKEFQADILFISAGFDAHIDDLYHWLDEEDFHWLVCDS